MTSLASEVEQLKDVESDFTEEEVLVLYPGDKVFLHSLKSMSDLNEKTGKVPEFVKLADPTLKSVWMKRKEIQQAYAQLVCEAWEAERPALPKALKELAEELLEDISDDGKIQTHIVVTGDICDKITIDALQSRIQGFNKKVVISNANLIGKMRDWSLCTDIKREMDNTTKKKVYVFYGVKLWKQQECGFGADY